MAAYRVKSVPAQMKSPKCVQLFTGPVKFQFVCLPFCQNHKSVEGENNKMSGMEGRSERQREVIGVKKWQTNMHGAWKQHAMFRSGLSATVTCSCENDGFQKDDQIFKSFISKNRSIDFFQDKLQLLRQIFSCCQKL